jgi:hypothetical protein
MRADEKKSLTKSMTESTLHNGLGSVSQASSHPEILCQADLHRRDFFWRHAVTRQGIEVVQLTTRLPQDVVDWLAAKAAVNLSNKNSELVRLCRETMARERAKA